MSPSVVALLMALDRITPPVLPETRLIAPGADGPKVVPNELSLMAKDWA